MIGLKGGMALRRAITLPALSYNGTPWSNAGLCRKKSFSNSPSRFRSVFDDRAIGPTNINLTTTLTPAAASVNNSTRDYTFSGTGRLSGGGSLTKLGFQDAHHRERDAS